MELNKQEYDKYVKKSHSVTSTGGGYVAGICDRRYDLYARAALYDEYDESLGNGKRDSDDMDAVGIDSA